MGSNEHEWLVWITWLSSKVSIRVSSALSRGVPVMLWLSYDNDMMLHVWLISART